MVKRKKKTTSILLKKNFRTLIKSKVQFLAVIFITALSMTLFVGLSSNALSINNRVNELYQGSNIADIWTTVTSEEDRDFRAIENASGIGGVTEKRLSLSAEVNGFSATALVSDKLPTVSKPYATDNTDETSFFIVDENFVNSKKLENAHPFVVDGVYQSVPVSFAFTLYQNIFKTTKLSDLIPFVESDTTIMDVFDLCVKNGGKNIFDSPYLEMNMQISGSMIFAENVETSLAGTSAFLLSRSYFLDCFKRLIKSNFVKPEIPSISDPDFILKSALNLGLFEIIENRLYSLFETNNQYVTKVGPDTSISDAQNAINNHFLAKEESNLVMCVDIDRLSSNVSIQNDILQATQLSYIFPIIFFLVAILVVLTTISQIIVKERTQIGTLKALGISRLRIILHYMFLAIMVVSIGAIIGIILGPIILPIIMNIKYDILYSLPPMVYTLAIIPALAAFAFVIISTLIVTYFVIRKDASLMPAMSMRPKVIKGLKEKKKVDKKKTASALSTNMAFRNIRLNITKSIMVILGIVGCTALLACGFGIDDTLNYGINKDLHNYYNADINVTYNSVTSLKDEISNIDGVDYIEEYATLPASCSYESASYQTITYLICDNSQFFRCDEYVIKDEIAISQKVAQSLNVKVGDVLSFNILGNTYEAKIGYISEVFFLHGIYINVEELNLEAIKSLKNNAWIRVENKEIVHDVSHLIQGVDGVTSATTSQEQVEVVNSYVSSLSMMTLAVKIFAILLAVVALYNFALMNYNERYRDVATLKVLGFSVKEIALSLIIEIMFLTIIGIGIGLLFGYPMEVLVLMVNETPLVEFLYHIYPISYFVSFLISFGTALLTNIVLSRKVKKIKMVESLKSIE